MKRRHFIRAALAPLALSLAPPLVFAGSAKAQQAAQFPTLRAENLNERALQLPRDFNADRSILLLAFKQNQQPDVNTWFPVLDQIEAARPGVKYYELPTLSASYRLARGFIDGGMRSGIPDPAQRARTITLYLDVQRFLARLGLPNQREQIYAVVIDRQGQVRGAVAGRYTKAKAQRLIAVL